MEKVIAARRNAMGLSQQKLAEELGVSQRLVTEDREALNFPSLHRCWAAR